MFDRILVPTDGSGCADVAIDYAEDLATRYGATVHLLSVVDSRIVDDMPRDEGQQDAHAAIVSDACDSISEETTVIEAVRTGLPHETILEYADEESIDLVVMGTHGRTGIQRFVLGSVTEKVLRLAETPVLTVRAEAGDEQHVPFESVLVPTDGSDAASTATDPALDVAGTYGAALHALSIIEPMAMGVDVQSHAIVDALEERANAAVDAIADQAESASISQVETAVQFGYPHEAIRAYVEDNDIDLIVMATHGRSGIERYLLGSVTEKIVRTSPVPVMTVRMPKSDAE